ncbi:MULTISPECIES: hypothetical protein [Dethiosulfovibrio]|uniref:Primosomal protein N' 3' DNA-binding domain-containing protein n=2 Tax=Dethiosulfovibrio TaxID=47054 RepID=A0ABS9EPY3_9BACT|nr:MULTISPECIES: hypothetical protein [Dethiosulfovibrio]MCF4113480.1 hypothetical protein [Dethiosulfovibrio russensis]MCF4141950.1 hypothetical protein [Dethiosulfovibrio marinus]MCF4144105.1 hypothetical protein [Dethiosulfovibrio acidaminovorans]
MTWFPEVLVPGPWWSGLTYRHDRPLEPGVRVRVPIGRGSRIGFVSRCDETSSWPEKKVRPIMEVLDESSTIPDVSWRLMTWVGRSFLCGVGQALSSMLPEQILKGEDLSPFIDRSKKKEKPSFSMEGLYRWLDDDRLKFYEELLGDGSTRAIISFPEQLRAKAFLKRLEDDGIVGGLLWPNTGGKKKMEAWLSVRDGNCRFVVGGPGVMAAPLEPDLVVVEDEGNDSYRMQRHPRLNGRSVLTRLAMDSRSRLVVGGRIPSSRVFRELRPEEERGRLESRVVFIDLNDANRVSVPGASDEIPLAEGTMTRTLDTMENGRVALWILDRKGYVGDLKCDDCEHPLRCDCGGTLRLFGGRGRCVRCGKTFDIPNKCPNCGGPVIMGRRPGLEALLPIAQAVVSKERVFTWSSDDPKRTVDRRDRIKELSSGGLVVGTRKSLELCDILDVGLVCWLDSDGEARRSEHDARYSAYTMISESCWRGPSPERRQVVIQSRRPGKGWQVSLLSGWTSFWRRELVERSELELPPFRYLAEIRVSCRYKERLIDKLVSAGLDVMDPDPFQDLIWVAVKHLHRLYVALESEYVIGSAEYPKVVLWTD